MRPKNYFLLKNEHRRALNNLVIQTTYEHRSEITEKELFTDEFEWVYKPTGEVVEHTFHNPRNYQKETRKMKIYKAKERRKI